MLTNICNGKFNLLANKSSNTREQKILCCLFLNGLPPPPTKTQKGVAGCEVVGLGWGKKVAQTFNSELETKFAFLHGTLLI